MKTHGKQAFSIITVVKTSDKTRKCKKYVKNHSYLWAMGKIEQVSHDFVRAESSVRILKI